MCRKPFGRFRSWPGAGWGGCLWLWERVPRVGPWSPGRAAAPWEQAGLPVRHRCPSRAPSVPPGRPFTGGGSTQDGGRGGRQPRWWLRGAARSRPEELRVRAWVGTVPREQGPASPGRGGRPAPAPHAHGSFAPGPNRCRSATAIRGAGCVPSRAGGLAGKQNAPGGAAPPLMSARPPRPSPQ